MRVLSELEPKNVFSFFEDICNIPHPSYKEEKISNYLVDFAKERKLEYYQDSLNNVIIIKEASKGYEDAAPIILQGHMDMVCEKTPDCDKNMDEDGLDLEVCIQQCGRKLQSLMPNKESKLGEHLIFKEECHESHEVNCDLSLKFDELEIEELQVSHLEQCGVVEGIEELLCQCVQYSDFNAV